MKKIFFTLFTVIIGFTANSQQIISQGDISQGEKLLEAYFTPIAESYAAGLNNGWYNTAKPHSLGGFDVTLTLNTVLIPNTAETFEIGNNFGGVFSSSEATASTIFGSSNETQMNYTNSTTNTVASFNMPGGLKTPIIPVPMLQAGIGLIKKTAVDIRYMPMLNIGNDINVNLFGFGLKHDLLQWIPAIGDAIPMSLSLQAGYTALDTELKIAGQEVSLNTRSTTINLVASKKLLMITGYAGIGYNSATTTLNANANFGLNGVSFQDNLELEFESNSSLRTNVGVRINLAILTLHADYTFSKYPTATIGVGVSLR